MTAWEDLKIAGGYIRYNVNVAGVQVFMFGRIDAEGHTSHLMRFDATVQSGGAVGTQEWDRQFQQDFQPNFLLVEAGRLITFAFRCNPLSGGAPSISTVMLIWALKPALGA